MRYRSILLVFAGMALTPLGACSGKSGDESGATKDGNTSLAEAMKSADDLSIFADALRNTGLADIFQGPGEYTVLAPSNGAFAKLGNAGTVLMEPDQKAALVVVVRNHILPGVIKPDDIESALAAAHGKPVTMTTMGSAKVSFAKEGDVIVVTGADGEKAKLIGSPIQVSHSIAIPIDTLLVPQ